MTRIAEPVATLTLPVRRRGLGPVRLSLILGLTAILLIVGQPGRDMARECWQATAAAPGGAAATQPAAQPVALPSGCPPR